MSPEDEIALVQAAIDQFRAVCPFSDDIEMKMVDLLESGTIVKTGDIQTDLVSAYTIAVTGSSAIH